jgi:tetratricopeptide (TPR) repeat protein
LVPFGRIWRVGANASTKITFDTDVTILGNKLRKGTYALYAFPEAKIWEVVFHNNTKHWGDGRKDYNPKEDALRVKITSKELESLQENFLITFDEIDHNALSMLWRWENTEIKIPIVVDTDGVMKAQIKERVKNNPTALTYYESARYYQEQGTNYETALDYLKKAIKIEGDTYYFHREKSLVEAALKDYKSAVNSAQKSLELAADQDKDEFVRMNEKNIKEWKRYLVIKK